MHKQYCESKLLLPRKIAPLRYYSKLLCYHLKEATSCGFEDVQQAQHPQ